MNSIFKTFLLSLMLVANTHLAYAQTASLLPNAVQQFFDNNGKPLTSGTVTTYIPNTGTLKTTWQDSGKVTPWANPLTLGAAGRPPNDRGIFGDGSYRQVVKDRNGNTIWDQVTSSTGSGSTPSTSTGDGDLVGTIKPWAGMTAPNQYAFTYGQEVSRTTYAALFTAITSTQSVFCNSGSPILNGLTDTTNFWIGMQVEVSCSGLTFTTIIAKSATTVTMAVNANLTTNVDATFYPWGGGNHTTTFNLPDLRGITLAGNNNMGGVASANLTTATTGFGAVDPNSIGAFSGAQSKTILTANLPPYSPAGTITSVLIDGGGVFYGFITPGGNVGFGGAATGGAQVAATSELTVSSGFSGNAQGGTSTPFSLLQPTRTTNYIIKITPDTNSDTASGVTSLGLMTGDIACGSGVLCTGNTISTTSSFANPTASVGLTAVNGVATSAMRADGAPALSQSIIPTWTGTHTFNNGTYSFLATNPAGFAGQTTPGAPIHVGTVAVASSNSSIVSARAQTGSTAVHGFAENSTVNLGAAAQGVNGYDAIPTFTGTQTYDHYAAFQSRPIYGSSGTITHIYGSYNGPTVNTGTATNSYAGYAANPTGTGTITNNYGFYSEALTKGATTNYAFFSAGATKNKFTGGLEGTTTNDSACAGCIGEYVEGTRVSGSASALTIATPLTIASISLTAGDWDVGGLVYFSLNAATSITDWRGSISTTTNTLDTTLCRTTQTTAPANVPGALGGLTAPSIGPCRFSLAGTTTVYLVAQSNFTINSNSAYGIIHARRVR